LACLPWQVAFSQNLKAKADENPLSTVFYLLSTTDKESKEDQKVCLAKSFAAVNKLAESKKSAGMFKDGGYAEDNLISVVNTLIKNKKIKEASDFATYLLKRFDYESYELKNLWNPLVVLNRGDEAVSIADRFDDDDKVEAYFAVADSYLKQNKSKQALEIVDKISPTVEKSVYDKDLARISLFYAKLGKEELSLKFAEKSMKSVKWETGIMEVDSQIIAGDVFEAYLLLGKYDLAAEILQKRGTSDEPKSLIQTAESYLSKGNRRKADELFEKSLSRLNPTDYSDSFDLGRLIEIYLKIGETDKAEKIAENLSGSGYAQQGKLLEIADYYLKTGNKLKASEILNFALEQTKKIDISEAENGQLWTSNKWDQARYQSQIALRFIDMQFDKEALALISQLKKPYLKALMLTEFVSVNKKRLHSQKLNSYLDEALLLLRLDKTEIFDSKRYDVFAITARNFAEIGMKQKSADVFAETLISLDKYVIKEGSENGLLFAMCNIGVEFESSKIKPNQKVKSALRNIIKNWENDEY
jgi:hypothetical protein